MSIKKILSATLLVVLLVAAVATFGAQTNESNLLKKIRVEAAAKSDMTGQSYLRASGCYNYCRFNAGGYNCGNAAGYKCCKNAAFCSVSSGIYVCSSYVVWDCPYA